MTIDVLQATLYWGGMLVFLVFELFNSYRPASVPKLRRWLINVPLALINGLLYHLIYSELLNAQLRNIETQGLGLLNLIAMPFWLQVLLGIILLDCVVYFWHLLNHVVPFFWRFHRVHHSDLNMDASTANRFHLGELLLSGVVRLTAVNLFGMVAVAYATFEIIANAAIQFHHSSVKVPAWFEELWSLLFVPPAMHRIHHSVKIRERDSNYGVILSVWDRMFRTLNMKVDQRRIVIGLGSHRDANRLGFKDLWLLPFSRKTP